MAHARGAGRWQSARSCSGWPRSRRRATRRPGRSRARSRTRTGKPVEGAVVTIEGSDSGSRKFTVKTNKSGDFIQIGLQPGQYKMTATKDALTQTLNQRISLDMVEVNFSLKPGGGRR